MILQERKVEKEEEEFRLACQSTSFTLILHPCDFQKTTHEESYPNFSSCL